MATDAAETETESWIAGIENEESIQGMYSIPPGTEQHPPSTLEKAFIFEIRMNRDSVGICIGTCTTDR